MSSNHSDHVEHSKALARFWKKVDKGLDTACWIWTGATKGNGYGQFYICPGLNTGAHRAAWILLVGDIPEGLCVLHRCDVRNCVNPNHLYVGTHSDNAKDKVDRGRDNTPRGSKSHFAKLSEDQVSDIRNMHALGDGCRRIGRLLGIPPATILSIVSGRTWRHLPGVSEGRHPARRGSKHGLAKLTEDGVRDIRKRYEHETAAAIAARYGVTDKCIYNIVCGDRWSHVV